MSSREKVEYRNIGKNLVRADAKDIVTGHATFFDDFKLKDVLYACRLGCPYPHAKITYLDTSKAEALPGVRAVLTYKNIPESMKHLRLGLPPIIPVMDQTLNFVGQAVAVVAAETKDVGEAALELIEVEYEKLEPVFWSHDSIKPDAPQLYDNVPGNLFPELEISGEEMMTSLHRGDVEKAFEECDFIEDGVCTYDKFGSPLAIEPPGVTAYVHDGRIQYYGTIQAPHTMQMFFQIKTQMPVDVKSFNVGGSFGNKSCMETTTSYLTILSEMTHRPVKMYMSKAEQLLVHDMRIGIHMQVKVGLKGGILHAVSGTINLDSGAINGVGQIQLGVGLGEMQVAFGKCQNWEVKGNVVVTNHVLASSVRGFGGQEVKSTLMPIVMRAVEKAGLDPLEFCMKNFAQTGDGWFWRDGNWWVAKDQDYSHVMKTSADKFGWKNKWKGWYVPTREYGNKAVGVGVSVHGNADVGEDQAEAYIRLEASGDVYLHNSITEIGMGQASNLRKYIADVLDIDAKKVIVKGGDTSIAPYDFGPAGSCSTLTTGEAVTRAAEDAREKLLNSAAETVFHCDPEKLTTKDGMVYMIDMPEKQVPWAFCMGNFGLTITGYGKWTANYSKSNFCIYFCEIEVDKDTGICKLLDVLVGTDVGQVIDPATLEMQAQGGFGAAAADTGLLDESVLDEYTGHIMTSNLIDYKWRPFNEFPPFEFIVEEDHPEGSRFKAVGFGEISGAPGPAAMMMAISNAIGKEFCTYPAHPKAVLKALGKT